MYDPLEMTSPRLFGKPLHLLFAKKKLNLKGEDPLNRVESNSGCCPKGGLTIWSC